MGLHAKLTQNLVLSNILQAFNEGIVLSTKAGVDPKLMLDILSNSAAKSGLIDYKAPFHLPPGFRDQFSVKWMHKDMGLMLDSARGALRAAFADRFEPSDVSGGDRDGHGEEDICSTIKVLEEMTGVEVKA